MVEREFCGLSGMAANKWCPARQREWVTAREEPPCSWHHVGDEGLLVVWPPEYRQWARQNGLLTDRTPSTAAAASPRAAATTSSVPASLEIANPPPGATYLIDPTLRPEFQTLSLRAVAARPGRIEWRVNGRTVGSSSSESPFHWPLRPGTHRIAVRDEAGRTAETTITVR
jgi:membrane carboxypeptidase/penicillin-binding protein PbpC